MLSCGIFARVCINPSITVLFTDVICKKIPPSFTAKSCAYRCNLWIFLTNMPCFKSISIKTRNISLEVLSFRLMQNDNIIFMPVQRNSDTVIRSGASMTVHKISQKFAIVSLCLGSIFAGSIGLAYAQDAAQNNGQNTGQNTGQQQAPTATQQSSNNQASSNNQKGTLRSKHGEWSILCDIPAGAKNEQCALIQNVVAADRPEVGLSVVALKTADNKARILRVLAPLGVLLPNGLGLNVDGKDIGRAYFVRCFEDGCYAEVILDDALMKTFRAGKSATFIVFQTPEEGIGIPVDLKGFSEGFDALP